MPHSRQQISSAPAGMWLAMSLIPEFLNRAFESFIGKLFFPLLVCDRGFHQKY